MKLHFSFPPEIYDNRRRELVRAAKEAVPGIKVSRKDRYHRLEVTLPENEELNGKERLIASWNACGVPVTEEDPEEIPPPIRMRGMTGARMIRLPVFFVSLIAVALAVSLLTFFLTYAFVGSAHSGETLGTYDESGEDYSGKIALIDRFFKEYSLYDTDGELLLDQMLKAYAAATGDRYAAYYTAEEYAALIAENTAKTVGIGVTVVEDAAAGGVRVVAVIPLSPADEAGVCAGDILISSGSGETRVTYADSGFEMLINSLRGEEGTVAVFTVHRGEETLDFSVTRAEVVSISVMGHVYAEDASVGIVRISQFDLSTPEQFKSTMSELIGKGCRYFVFDVRSNPGGDLKSICAVLSYFLNENDRILSTVAKDGTTVDYQVSAVNYTNDYATCSVQKEEIGMYRGYSAAVLTNGNTASAAELFTAALRDYDLAVIVGETTFGKGIIQSIYSLARYGYSGGIKLTVGYYSPPCGVNYDGVGISPDVPAAQSEEAAKKNLYLLTDGEDDQLRAAVWACKS